MATANFTIKPSDGWVAVTSAGVDFIRITSTNPNHAFFVTTGSALPAASVVGFKEPCNDFWCDVPEADNFYVRVADSTPDQTRIDVFSVPT